MLERKYRLRDIAAAHDIPLARVRTMRARGQTAMHDSGVDDGLDDARPGSWRPYSLLDAVAFGCVIELIQKGLTPDAAANIVGNCNGFIAEWNHPSSAHHNDIWIGAVFFDEGRAHVGGPLGDVLVDAEKKVRREIRVADGGTGTGIILVNASAHYRKLREALDAAE